jgi:hypothetical protein
MQRLSMDQEALQRARQNLQRLKLIAHKKPLYQVLALDAPLLPVATAKSTQDGPLSMADILQTIAGGV